MPTPYVRPTRYVVNLLPDSIGFYAQLFEIIVERHGVNDRWAVLRHDQVLGSDGTWAAQLPPSERDDNWLDAHRFDHDTALRLAEEAAPHVTVKGRTAAEVLARLLATGRIAHTGEQPAAVLPEAADQAAAIRADAFKAAANYVRGHSADERYGKASISTALCAVSDELRRRADEAQQPETQGATEPFGTGDCTCIPFVREGGTARYCQPGDTVDQISGWERGLDCPHHRKPAAVSQPGKEA